MKTHIENISTTGRHLIIEVDASDKFDQSATTLPRWNQAVRKAVTNLGLTPISPPQIEINELADNAVDSGVISLTLNCVPEFTVEIPEKLVVMYAGLPVSDDEARALAHLTNAEDGVWEATNIPINRGHVANVDIKVIKDGVVVDEMTQTGIKYFVGATYLTPDVDDVLIGMRQGDSVTIETTMPGEFGTGSDPVEMEIHINANMICQVPPITTAWIQENTNASTFEELVEIQRLDLTNFRTQTLMEGIRTALIGTVGFLALEALTGRATEVVVPTNPDGTVCLGFPLESFHTELTINDIGKQVPMSDMIFQAAELAFVNFALANDLIATKGQVRNEIRQYAKEQDLDGDEFLRNAFEVFGDWEISHRSTCGKVLGHLSNRIQINPGQIG